MRDLDAEAMKKAAFAVFAKANENNLGRDKIEALWPSQHYPHWDGLAEAAVRAYLSAAAIGAGGQAVAEDIETQAWECDKWPAWLDAIVERTNAVADRLDMSSEQAHAYAVLSALSQPHPAEELVVALPLDEAAKVCARLERDASWDKCGHGYYRMKQALSAKEGR